MVSIYGSLRAPNSAALKRNAQASESGLLDNWKDILPGMPAFFDPKTSKAGMIEVMQEWVNVIEDGTYSGLYKVELANEGCKWVGMSMLQKSIRRSDEVQAMVAASALINSGMAQLMWRRLAVIGLEDLGLGGLPALALVLGHLNGDIQVQPEMEHELAEAVIQMMVHACKDRSACDSASLQLTKSIRWLEAEDQADMDLDSRLAVLLDREQPFAHRLHALKAMVRRPKAAPLIVYACNEMQVPAMIPMIMQGYKQQHKDPMWIALPLLWDMAQQGEVTMDTHTIKPSPEVQGIPGHSFDMFTSDGKRAMAYFRKACAPAKAMLENDPGALDKLGFAVFAAEGGALDRSVGFHGRDSLATETLIDEFDSVGMTVDQASELCHIVEENLDLLNHARGKVVHGPVIREID